MKIGRRGDLLATVVFLVGSLRKESFSHKVANAVVSLGSRPNHAHHVMIAAMQQVAVKVGRKLVILDGDAPPVL